MLERRIQHMMTPLQASCTFKIKVWQDRGFAETVRNSVPVAIGRNLWIMDAYIKVEGDQSQPIQHAKTLEDYLTLVQSGKRYSETELRVRGPRGRGPRIHVYDIHALAHEGPVLIDAVGNSGMVVRPGLYGLLTRVLFSESGAPSHPPI